MKENNQILSREKLESLVDNLGYELTDKYHEYGGGIVFICVMKGGFMFFIYFLKNIG